jgi:luciferase family oxidoreductase group 1
LSDLSSCRASTGISVSALEILVAQQRDGLDARETLLAAASIAQGPEELGYHRVWYPEHHASPYARDFPPGIVIAHVAGKTRRIRLGSGGALAPNHVALSVSEQFEALAALHPGRVDMGVGRGPGTLDPEVARALRRGAAPASDEECGHPVSGGLHAVTVASAAERHAQRPHDLH